MLEMKVVDKSTTDIIGRCFISLKEFKDQERVEKFCTLKALSGPEEMGELRIRIRVFWSKLNYFQNKIQEADDKIESAKKEISEVLGYMNLLDKPFGLIIYGQINNLKDEDILETPGDKEKFAEKKRLSVLPTQGNSNRALNPNFANKIDHAIRGTLSKCII